MGKRGWALESVAARICREGGGRVTTNVLVRDLDLALPGAVADGRRLEVVVDGLPLFGGAQLAVDTTLVCALRSDGRPTTRAAVEDGAKVTRARRRKETTFPELVGRHARARLVVLGVEVGGRFSTETESFLSQLARAKARCENSAAQMGFSFGLHPVPAELMETHQLHTWSGTTACVEATQLAVSVIL